MRYKEWIALVPAYEPGEELLPMLRELSENGFRILVVNDGSSGSAEEIFRQAAEYAEVLVHTENKGKGAALKTGFNKIIERTSDTGIIVTLDADGQHAVKDAVRLCTYAESHPDTLVLGSRALKEHVPLRSRFGNTVTRLVFRLSTGVGIHDTQTGLRAFSASMLSLFLEIEGERYEYEMNMLLACAKKKIPMKEMEIETIYLNDNASSHFDTIRDSGRIYKEIVKFSGSSFVSFLVDYSLFSLLVSVGSGVTAANIGARFVSATVNYTMNRRFVFNSDEGERRSFAGYVCLAVCILAGNTLVLKGLVTLGMIPYAAKIVTELSFFLLSWFVQRRFIFRRRTVRGGSAA